MASYALQASGLGFSLAELDDTGVGVVAEYAIQDDVLALEQTAYVILVQDETILGFHLLLHIAQVALVAQGGISLHYHSDTARVGNVEAARAVTGFTLDAGLGPRTRKTWQVGLGGTGVVAGGVTSRTIGDELVFTGVIRRPTCLYVERLVGQVVLVEVLGVARYAWGVSDDVAVGVQENGFPVVPADDVADIVPGVSFGRIV